MPHRGFITFKVSMVKIDEKFYSLFSFLAELWFVTHRDARAFFLWVRGVDPAMKLPFAGENPLKGADCNCGKS